MSQHLHLPTRGTLPCPNLASSSWCLFEVKLEPRVKPTGHGLSRDIFRQVAFAWARFCCWKFKGQTSWGREHLENKTRAVQMMYPNTYTFLIETNQTGSLQRTSNTTKYSQNMYQGTQEHMLKDAWLAIATLKPQLEQDFLSSHSGVKLEPLTSGSSPQHHDMTNIHIRVAAMRTSYKLAWSVTTHGQKTPTGTW